MMSNEQIISKGKYTHPQPDSIVGVKQYLFVRDEDGKKRLLLRFCNNRDEACSKFVFTVYRLDVKGNVLGEERFECDNREFGAKEVFSFEHRIDVEEKCTDFVVKVGYAKYGNYTHQVENNDVSVVYSEKNDVLAKKTKGKVKEKPRKINERSFEMSWTLAVISVVILALVFAATAFLVKDYKENNTDFLLHGVYYKFADESKTSIVITGCSNAFDAITLSNELDGYEVVGIQEGAFKSNAKLKEITINGINIDDNTFNGCERLEKVKINNVTYIGTGAFMNCGGLKTVTINEGKEGQLISIGSGAFGNCKKLDKVEINQLIKYGDKVDFFAGSTEITELKLQNFAYTMENEPSFAVSRLGSLFGVLNNGEGTLELEALTVEKMDAVPANFVSGFKKLTSVTINAENVKAIGKEAFKDCGKLAEITLKSKAEVVDSYAFSGTAITSFDLSGVSSMGEGVFKDASKLSSISGLGNGGIDSIPKNTFSGCASLTGISIGESVKHIYKGAFNSSGLTKLSIPAGVTSDMGIVVGCSKLTELEIYELEEGGYIGYYFGVDKENVVSKGAASIPVSLKSITIGAGTRIYDYAFASCTGLELVQLPDGITYFGDYAFWDCKKLSDIKIPDDGITYVGDFAFAHTLITELNLSASVANIGQGALSNCKKIESLTIPFLGKTPTSGGTISHIFGAEQGSGIPASLKTITLIPVIPMVALPDYAFAGCIGATTISVPNTISVIGEGAYYDCKELASIDTSNITSIGSYAFSGCSSLSTVALSQSLAEIGAFAFEDSGIVVLEIPDSVLYIGRGIISGCNKLVSLTTPFMGEKPTSVQDVGIAYLCSAAGGITDDVPKSLNTITLTRQFVDKKIPKCAFYNCQSLSSVVIPAGITEIGESAFYNCKSLTSYNLEGVTSIGINAFAWSGLTSVSVPEGMNILSEGVFASCASLTSVSLPSTMRSIGAHAFENTGLEQIEIPGSVVRIGSYVFSGSAIKTIALPGKLSTLGENVFKGCDKLESITFPMTSEFYDSGMSVSSYMFDSSFPESLKSVTVNGCYLGIVYTGSFTSSEHIEEVVLDARVSIIEPSAFAKCYGLRFVSIPSSVSDVSPSAFGECYHLYEISNDSDCEITSPYVIAYTTEETRAPVVTFGGFKFAKYNGQWYVINYEKGTTVKLPTDVEFNGERLEQYAIPNHLFFDDDVVETVVASVRVSGVGKQAFQSCEALKSVSFANNNRVISISESSFAYCSSLESVILPNSVKTIEKESFYLCTSLKNVEFPVALETVEERAFYECSNLSSAKLFGNVRFIGEESFYNCVKLYDVYSICPLSIEAGSSEYGYVARYAVAVHTDMEANPSVQVSVPKIGEFMCGGGQWLLISGYDGENIVLDTFVQDNQTVDSFRIAAGAFSDRFNVQSVTIGNAVKQIQERAFSNCPSLKSVDMSENSSLLKLETRAFEYCSALRTVKFADTIKSIGDSAFTGCSSLEEAVLSTKLQKIGSYAFAGCERMISVTLGSLVDGIGENAFDRCENLYEVINLSKIKIAMGESENGKVARNAKAVFSVVGQGFERLEQKGMKLIYVDSESTWYLYSFEDNGEKILDISNLGGNFVILEYALENGTFTGIVLPSNLRRIEAYAFHNCFALNNVYFAGTESQWENIYNFDESTFYNLYFKTDCIHDDSENIWAYDLEGKVTTDKCSERSEITKAPSCYDIGERTFYCNCPDCDFTRVEVEMKLEHEFDGGVCKNCGQVKTSVDASNIDSYIQSEEIFVKDFVYDEKLGCFTSTNKDHNSASAFKITADGIMTVSFVYEASSEIQGDYIAVYVNGIMNGRLSGKSSDSFNIVLEEGDVLTISYEKNDKKSLNNDCGYIKGLEIIEAPEQSVND